MFSCSRSAFPRPGCGNTRTFHHCFDHQFKYPLLFRLINHSRCFLKLFFNSVFVCCDALIPRNVSSLAHLRVFPNSLARKGSKSQQQECLDNSLVVNETSAPNPRFAASWTSEIPFSETGFDEIQSAQIFRSEGNHMIRGMLEEPYRVHMYMLGDRFQS